MRRAAGSTLRKAALGGWAVLALTALPAATGTALAADGHGHGRGHGATDGPRVRTSTPGRRSKQGSRGDEPDGGGDRGSDGALDARRRSGRRAGARHHSLSTVVRPSRSQPQIDIGTALGPICGAGARAATTRRARGGRSTSGCAPRAAAELRCAVRLRAAVARRPAARRAGTGTLVQVAIRRGSAARGCGWWNPRTATLRSGRAAAVARVRGGSGPRSPVGGGRLALARGARGHAARRHAPLHRARARRRRAPARLRQRI